MSVAIDRDHAFLDAVRTIADEVAAPNADSVDQLGRFPSETIDALRSAEALSAAIPSELGGAGMSFETIAAACFELGRRCSSSAMVFAMHQIKVVSILRHHEDVPWLTAYLESVAAEQRLVASVTTELGTGGDMGRSIAPLTPSGEGTLAFEKQAPVISYGNEADDLFVTLRREPDAAESDQVVAIARSGQFTLEQNGTWDTMGMRGTCSPGFVVRAEIGPEQILPTPYSRMMAETLVPVTHILWSHLWLGIATDAFDRARAFAKAAAKRSASEEPVPAALGVSQLMSQLTLMRGEVRSGLADFIDASSEPGRERLLTMSSVLRFNNLKIASSDQAARICQDAMSVCGIMGFKNGTPYSVGRHLRDAMSASVMVNNESIHRTNANLLLIAKDV